MQQGSRARDSYSRSCICSAVPEARAGKGEPAYSLTCCCAVLYVKGPHKCARGRTWGCRAS